MTLQKGVVVLCSLTQPGHAASYPLGLHGLGYKVVLVHGTDPLADGGASFGDLGDGSWLKLWIVNVGLDG